MRPKWGQGRHRGAEKCGRKLYFLGAEGSYGGSRKGGVVLGSTHRQASSRYPSCGGATGLGRSGSRGQAAAPCSRRSRCHGGNPGEDRSVRRLPLQTRGPLQPGAARPAVRPEDWAAGVGEALQVAPPRSLKFAAGEETDSILPLPPARGSTRPGRLSLGGSSAHFPLGTRPAPVADRLSGLHPSLCPRAPRSLPPRWMSRTT